MQPAERKLYVQVLAQMLIADGVLADAERDFLDQVIARLGMSPEERKAAFSGISLDSPIEERIHALSTEARGELAKDVELVSSLDGEVRRSEEAMLDRVRAALAALR